MGAPGDDGGSPQLRRPPTAEGARLRKRSVVVAGHSTSVSLEQAFWHALKEIAARRRMPLAQVVAEVDAQRSGNLSSALRVYVLEQLQAEMRMRDD